MSFYTSHIETEDNLQTPSYVEIITPMHTTSSYITSITASASPQTLPLTVIHKDFDGIATLSNNTVNLPKGTYTVSMDITVAVHDGNYAHAILYFYLYDTISSQYILKYNTGLFHDRHGYFRTFRMKSTIDCQNNTAFQLKFMCGNGIYLGLYAANVMAGL